MKQIILASASPRRKELLEKAGINFIIDAASIEETMDEALPIEQRLMRLAQDKASAIHQKYPHDVVIGADTIVYDRSQIIGKAKDIDEAKQILTRLSNHPHRVYTAVAIYDGNQLLTFIDHTDVYFKDIHDLIDDYLASGEWAGKAGAYGIQGKADVFVDHIDGDIDTVIGLPVKKLTKILEKNQII